MRGGDSSLKKPVGGVQTDITGAVQSCRIDC